LAITAAEMIANKNARKQNDEIEGEEKARIAGFFTTATVGQIKSCPQMPNGSTRS
jgi:hypothetical protein